MLHSVWNTKQNYFSVLCNNIQTYSLQFTFSITILHSANKYPVQAFQVNFIASNLLIAKYYLEKRFISKCFERIDLHSSISTPFTFVSSHYCMYPNHVLRPLLLLSSYLMAMESPEQLRSSTQQASSSSMTYFLTKVCDLYLYRSMIRVFFPSQDV